MAIITIATVDPDNDDFTASAPHKFVNGDRARLSATTAPSGIINGTTYFARVINATKFALHATRADARNNVNQIAISSQGSDVTFIVGDSRLVILERSLIVGHPGSEPVTPTFSDYSRELIFVENVNTDYSKVVVPNGKLSDQVAHDSYELVPSQFTDYSNELVFVEGVSTTYSEKIVGHGKLSEQVFMQGLTTSPTYIFTSGEPKAAPGPPEITEVWIVS